MAAGREEHLSLSDEALGLKVSEKEWPSCYQLNFAVK